MPMLPGTFSWGIVTGLAMIQAGLTVPQAIAFALLAYSGVSQLTALPMLASGATLGSIFLVTTLVSLRFVLYSIGLVRDYRHIPPLRRLLLGYFTTDTTITVYFDLRRRLGRVPQRLSYIHGAIWPVWGVWQLGQFVGIGLAGLLPPSEALVYFGTLAMLVMILPRILGRAAIACALAAGIIALLTTAWPYRLGTLAAVVGGMIAALIAEHLAPPDVKASPAPPVSATSTASGQVANTPARPTDVKAPVQQK